MRSKNLNSIMNLLKWRLVSSMPHKLCESSLHFRLRNHNHCNTHCWRVFSYLCLLCLKWTFEHKINPIKANKNSKKTTIKKSLDCVNLCCWLIDVIIQKYRMSIIRTYSDDNSSSVSLKSESRCCKADIKCPS